jgi:hypothetical protein
MRRGGEGSTLSLPPSYGRDSVAGVAKTYPGPKLQARSMSSMFNLPTSLGARTGSFWDQPGRAIHPSTETSGIDSKERFVSQSESRATTRSPAAATTGLLSAGQTTNAPLMKSTR